jgi:hypothetical protein
MFSPLVALGLVFLVTGRVGPSGAIDYLDPRFAYASLVCTYGHLCAVVFRSHVNPRIFVRHRFRFVAVPILLYLAMVSSLWVFAIAFVLTGFWDVYHSSAQNFGFCRIYDSRQGNAAERGRALDLWLNHVIYIGPILGGVNLIAHLDYLKRMRHAGVSTEGVIASIASASPIITRVVLAAGLLYVAFYVFSYWRLSRQGYRVSPQKVCLLGSAAGASLVAWGFLPAVQAFFVSNFFHAFQYFGIVWWSEKGSIRRALGLSSIEAGGDLALVAFGALVVAMGVGYYFASDQPTVPWVSIAVVISLMHFWYDGFVWSVRRHEVG